MNINNQKMVTIRGPGKTLIQGRLVISHPDGMVTVEIDDVLYTGYPTNESR